MTGVLSALSCFAGCDGKQQSTGAAAPEVALVAAEPNVPIEVGSDAWNKLVADRREMGGVCVLHESALEAVHPYYMGGLVTNAQGLYDSSRQHFPMSNYPFLSGCSGPTGWGQETIYACPKCSDAETAWRKEHKKPTWKNGVWTNP